jgi:hypothetical protein
MHWARLVIESLLNYIYSDPEHTNTILCSLDEKEHTITTNPRAAANAYAVSVSGILLFELAEKKYGKTSLADEAMSIFPTFSSHYRSQVGVNIVTVEHPTKRFSIYLGAHINTWEQFFYELAHESIHMLGPACTNEVSVATLDEGVAVKFAENFYQDYIFPVSGLPIPSTPLSAPHSVYFKAFYATDKIPDKTLVEIRKKFRNFHEVSNPVFYDMTRDYLSKAEADLLCSAFDYSAN